MRKALIREVDGLVLNVIVLNFPNKWPQPEGTYCVAAKDASPGDKWDGEKFVKPELPPSEAERDIYAELDELKAKLTALEAK